MPESNTEPSTPRPTSTANIACTLYENALFFRMAHANATIEPGDPFNEDSEEPRKIEVALNIGSGSILVTDERTGRTVSFSVEDLICSSIDIFKTWNEVYTPQKTDAQSEPEPTEEE